MRTKITLTGLSTNYLGDISNDKPNVATYTVEHITPWRTGTVLTETVTVVRDSVRSPSFEASINVKSTASTAIEAMLDLSRKLRRMAEALELGSAAPQDGFPSFSWVRVDSGPEPGTENKEDPNDDDEEEDDDNSEISPM